MPITAACCRELLAAAYRARAPEQIYQGYFAPSGDAEDGRGDVHGI